MSDEEDDYMSMKVLQEAEQFELQRKEASYSERRKKQLREQEKKAYIKPRAQLEAEEREKALQRSLEEDKSNKGMKMLMKMGFKKGMSLGKTNEGIAEPIKVSMKADRQGIGMENETKKRLRELEEEEMNKKKVKVEDFRAIKAQQARQHQWTKYLVAAISICKKLDEENGIDSNILWVLEPEHEPDSTIEEEEEEDKIEEQDSANEDQDLYPEEEVKQLKELDLEQQVSKVIEYLRHKYFYCFWCRAKYDNEEDLDTNCPGTEEDDH